MKDFFSFLCGCGTIHNFKIILQAMPPYFFIIIRVIIVLRGLLGASQLTPISYSAASIQTPLSFSMWTWGGPVFAFPQQSTEVQPWRYHQRRFEGYDRSTAISASEV